MLIRNPKTPSSLENINLNQQIQKLKHQKKPQQVLNQAYLAACLRQTELSMKPHTTLEEDLELELLQDPETRSYAKRMVELEFNEKKTEFEKKEYLLLKDPTTRPYAKRILELEQIPRKSFMEDKEFNLLIDPKTREYYKSFISLANKLKQQKLNASQESRAKFLFISNYSTPIANEIFKLEELPELNEFHIDNLAKLYLLKISETPPGLIHEIDNNTQLSLPTINCLRGSLCNNQIVKFRSVEHLIDSQAQELAEKFYKQALAPKTLQCSFFNEYQYRQNLFATQPIQNLIQRKKAMLALALKKVFFDSELNFSNQVLDTIINYLSTQIMNKKLDLSPAKFKELYNRIEESLKHFELPAEKPKQRHGW